MLFDFDPHKNWKNLERHGIDFEEAQKLWEGTHIIIPTKYVGGEDRYAILGKIRGKVYMGICTERNDVTRIISCHRADKKWEKLFYAYLKKTEK